MTQVGPVFTELEEYIAHSRASVVAGEDVNLIGLDDKIGALCDMVLELSADEKLLYEDRLRDLLEGLNQLGIEMRERESVRDTQVHRNASVAYKTADSRDNFGKREEEE